MRIPIPLVLLFSVIVVLGVWWIGTRRIDFMAPPPESKLAKIREMTEAAVPNHGHDDNAVAPPVVPVPTPPPPPPPPPKPVIDLGNLNSPPTITEYLDQAPKGSAHLIELAGLLEAKGESQRALLAWERVLDSGKPDENQAKTAVSAIRRLRPTLPNWNTNPKKAISITLHAEAGKKIAKDLIPVLDKIAKDVEHASAGILKVNSFVTAGRDVKSTKPPIAIRITGPNKRSRSTAVLSFTFESKTKLAANMEKTVFEVIRGFIGQGPSQTPPPAMSESQTPTDAIHCHITRQFWMDLGKRLNQPPD